MEMGPERSEGGEPPPQARRAEMEMGPERSEGGEPPPQARRAEMEMGPERSEGGEPRRRRDERIHNGVPSGARAVQGG